VDALVICSRIDNQPLVVMEAMARGIPTIATDVGGLPDLVEDGITGQLVPPGDSAALADTMEAFVRDVARASRLGAAGREKLAREFSPAQWIARHIELYRGL
jgi:glycosyltransferase involved in cell wall biosynthesis